MIRDKIPIILLYNRWQHKITWWPQWTEQSFINLIFQLNLLRQIRALRYFRNSRFLDLISQNSILTEEQFKHPWQINEEVSIKLMIQIIKLKEVPAVKSRKRKKKEVKVYRRKQTLAQAEECQTFQLLLSSVIRIIPHLTCT